MTLDSRFDAKIDRSAECWLWTAVLDRYGYGRFWLDGKMRKAHRVAYEMCVGPIPSGLDIDHLCRVRSCVNPDHLEPVTHRENMLRGDTVNARNAAKSHCAHGHPFDDANTHVYRGSRKCRTCRGRREVNA